MRTMITTSTSIEYESLLNESSPCSALTKIKGVAKNPKVAIEHKNLEQEDFSSPAKGLLDSLIYSRSAERASNLSAFFRLHTLKTWQKRQRKWCY